MKNIITFAIFLLMIITANAQENPQEAEVKETIQEFFQAFHDQDSTKLRAMVDPSSYMQSIA